MKKQYIKPTLKIIGINTSFICSSNKWNVVPPFGPGWEEDGEEEDW